MPTLLRPLLRIALPVGLHLGSVAAAAVPGTTVEYEVHFVPPRQMHCYRSDGTTLRRIAVGQERLLMQVPVGDARARARARHCAMKLTSLLPQPTEYFASVSACMGELGTKVSANTMKLLPVDPAPPCPIS